jgi:hypothetical protein
MTPERDRILRLLETVQPESLRRELEDAILSYAFQEEAKKSHCDTCGWTRIRQVCERF